MPSQGRTMLRTGKGAVASFGELGHAASAFSITYRLAYDGAGCHSLYATSASKSPQSNAPTAFFKVWNHLSSEHFADLRRQLVDCEGLGQKIHARVEHAVVDDGVLGEARG